VRSLASRYARVVRTAEPSSSLELAAKAPVGPNTLTGWKVGRLLRRQGRVAEGTPRLTLGAYDPDVIVIFRHAQIRGASARGRARRGACVKGR